MTLDEINARLERLARELIEVAALLRNVPASAPDPWKMEREIATAANEHAILSSGGGGASLSVRFHSFTKGAEWAIRYARDTRPA